MTLYEIGRSILGRIPARVVEFILPWVFVALVIGIIVPIFAAVTTGEWRYLIISAGCYWILANPTS